MKSSKLTNLGRRKALKSQLEWLSPASQSATTRENQIEMVFPDWLKKLEDEAPIENGVIKKPSKEDHLKEVYQFAYAARAIGRGRSNVLLALTQILSERLTGQPDIEGVPPIRDWNDVSAIFRAISNAEDGLNIWAQAIGIGELLDDLEAIEFDEC